MFEPRYFSLVYILLCVKRIDRLTFDPADIYLPIGFRRKDYIIAYLDFNSKPRQHTGADGKRTYYTAIDTYCQVPEINSEHKQVAIQICKWA